MSKDKDLVLTGLEMLGRGTVAPVMAAVDFATNGGKFSDDGIDHAFRAVLPDVDNVDDLLDD